MGRKSALTEDQWSDVERRHLVDGISINALAQEFGINESSIRRRIKPNKAEAPNSVKALQAIAEKKVQVDSESRRIAEQIAALPFAKQQIVSDLARKMANISEHIGSAAEFSAASAHRLSMLANQQLERVDGVNPLNSPAELQAAALLQKMANQAGEMPINLARANKAPPETPKPQEEVDGELMMLLERAGGGSGA